MLTTLPLILLTSPLFYCKNLLSSSPNPFFPSLNPAKYPLSFSVNTARSLTIHTHSPKRMKGKMAHKVVLFGLSYKQIYIDLLSFVCLHSLVSSWWVFCVKFSFVVVDMVVGCLLLYLQDLCV